MQKTSNYSLKKPEVTDPLRVADFNENADIIDAALASMVNAVPYVVGSYETTNDSNKDLMIDLGFQPSMVIIKKPGEVNVNFGTVCTRDTSVVVEGKTLAAVTETGFVVGMTYVDGRAAVPYTNVSGPFVYIAFR